ncbi:MAG: hypothetical protein M1830_000753 [Pleopsidium flavum]|nr:MAG: hypothetical protein M1830_000753 [Pleopsidium flavum]
MLAATAYFFRGLQIILKTSKRGITERAEELGTENDQIPLTQGTRTQVNTFDTPSAATSTLDVPNLNQTTDLAAPPRTQDPAQVRGTGGPPTSASLSETIILPPPLRQDPLPLTRAQKWAAVINRNLDTYTYSTLFLLIGIPIYYANGYAMPLHLTLNILAYFAALSLPARYKRVLHPVLVSSALTILGIWVLAVCRRESLHEGLRAYSTKTRYLQLWNGAGKKEGLRRPGAGDVFGSVLDVSIVALALPMFQYRNELKRHFLSIIIPNLTISVASLFGYPLLCHAIGISSKRSLSFAARSLTLALATPATANLGGDLNLVAVLCIMSGILGVLVGPVLLKWLRIPDG